MSHRTTCPVLVLLLVAALQAGCSDPQSESLKRDVVIGTWRVAPGHVTSNAGVVLATTQPGRRLLEFKRDGSFSLTLCDDAGHPLEPAQTVTGTWTVSAAAIVLHVKAETPTAGRAGWVPERFLGWQAGAPGPADDTLDFRTRNGVRVRYARQPAQP